MSSNVYIAAAGAAFCSLTAIIHGHPFLAIGMCIGVGVVYLWERSNID